jgi:hypothetical protein
MKKRLSNLEAARKTAHSLLDEFGVESPDPLQIDALAHRLGIELVETRLDGARA